MGVPKFYRWISERYPCLSEVIKEYQMPEFDNLYLDMNGIIHTCSHPNDDDPHFRISDEKIFADIFHYIEILFRIIRPKKVFFMAVDGVAPRAKMNQQRGRRFRSARDAKSLEEDAIKKGEVLPTEARFDSNCITPGTEFMVRLHEQLKFFVSTKISTDSMWQGLRIYLSGHETPGEGEHKIMDFIRYEKSQPGYDSNTRHCLYGLDADLIMLGLCSHEPHFSLLREEVKFGKSSQKRIITPEQTTFHLLHLSLLRDYLEHEFESVKDSLFFKYDLEHIIDDWVLMGFLVGNDFIPHLPNLHIAQDALPVLYKTYMNVLPSLDGYINEGGFLNLVRFEKYMKELSKLDYEKFEENYADLKWLEGKSCGQRLQNGDAHEDRKPKKKFNSTNVRAGMFDSLAELCDDLGDFNTEDSLSGEDVVDHSASIKHSVTISMSSDSDSIDDDEVFEIEFRTQKRDYYMNKLDFKNVTNEVLEDQAVGYVRAIQWNLHYYYNGVASWSWFYPHHYAPYISDIQGFSHKTVEFECEQPFLPYEQLLSVLPALSKRLLPRAYQDLMCDPNSPLIEFYPTDFKTDLNGKQQDWEAVVLIPFLDEKKLLNVMKLYEPLLTKSERNRNKHGPCLLYTYVKDSLGCYESSLPDRFPDISFNHAKLQELDRSFFFIEPSKIYKGLCKEVLLDVYFPGFPTLKHIQHAAKLKKESVVVFQQQSRKDSLVLSINPQDKRDLDDVARDLLGEVVYVSWPHIIEARVTAVSSSLFRYYHEKNTKYQKGEWEVEELSDKSYKLFKNFRQGVVEKHKRRLGIDLGDIDILLYVQHMTGRKCVFSASGRITMEKHWSPVSQAHPLQTVIKDLSVYNPIKKPYSTVEEMFSENSTAFMLGHPHYGCEGQVLNIDKTGGKCKVRVKINIPREPEFANVVKNSKRYSDSYLPGHVVAQRLGISSHFISRITGSILIVPIPRSNYVGGNSGGHINVGLNLKFNKKNEEVPGFSKKVNGHWSYSQRTVEVIFDYLDKFPDLVNELAENIGSDVYHIDDIFHGTDAWQKLREVQNFLKSLPSANVERQPCGTENLDSGIVKAIEEAVDEVHSKGDTKLKAVTVLVRPKLLFKPSTEVLTMSPDMSADYQLFDRVVNVRQGHSVPLGLRGITIGVHRGETSQDAVYDVLFDATFVGALSLQSSSNRVYKMSSSALINLSYGKRKNERLLSEQDGVYCTDESVNNSPKSRAGGGDAQVFGETNRQKDRSADPSWRKDKYEHINHSPTAPFQPRGNVQFITPKISDATSLRPNKNALTLSDSKNRLSDGRRNSESANDAGKKKTSQQNYFEKANSGEFQEIWNVLREGQFSENRRKAYKPEDEKITLQHAAQSLPNVSRRSRTSSGKIDSANSSYEATVGSPAVNASEIKDYNDKGSAALKELLKINDVDDVNEENVPTKKLSVEQLMKDAKEAMAHKSSPPKPVNSSESLGQKSNSPSPNTGAVVELLSLVQSKQVAIPVYNYVNVGDKVSAEVSLPDGNKVMGKPCGDRQQASESAAAQALALMMMHSPSGAMAPHGPFGQPTNRALFTAGPAIQSAAKMPLFNNLPSRPRVPGSVIGPRHQFQQNNPLNVPRHRPPPHLVELSTNVRFNCNPLYPPMSPHPFPPHNQRAFGPNFRVPPPMYQHFKPYEKWSLGDDVSRPLPPRQDYGVREQMIHGRNGPYFQAPMQLSAMQTNDQLAFNSAIEIQNNVGSPFIPMQVTKHHQTPKKKTTSECSETDVLKVDGGSVDKYSPASSSASGDLSHNDEERSSSDKQTRKKPPKPRLACGFSNA